MAPRKASPAPDTPSRPRGRRGPSTAIALPSTRSGTRSKSNTNGRIMKTPSKKKYVPAYLDKDEDEDGEFEWDDGYLDKNESRNLRSEAVEDEYIESDDALEVDNDSEDYSPTHSKSKAKSNVAAVSKRSYRRRNTGATPDPNGRVKGRDLVPWTRARMTEKLMLHLVYESEVAGIKLPWDAAVKRLHPGSKEGAATQHLNKLRTILLTEGHLVPPKARTRNRLASENNPEIRGYIRPDGAGPFETREVGWDEKIEDLVKSIENPEIIRGSGRYPRTKKSPTDDTRNRGQTLTSPPAKVEPPKPAVDAAARRKRQIEREEQMDNITKQLEAETKQMIAERRFYRQSRKPRTKNSRVVQDEDDYGGGDEESDSDNGSAEESDIESDSKTCENSDDDVTMDEDIHTAVGGEAKESVKDAVLEEDAEDVEGAGLDEEADISVEGVICLPGPGPRLVARAEAAEYGGQAAFDMLARVDPAGRMTMGNPYNQNMGMPEPISSHAAFDRFARVGPGGSMAMGNPYNQNMGMPQPVSSHASFDRFARVGPDGGMAMGNPYNQNMGIPEPVSQHYHYHQVSTMGQVAAVPRPSNAFSVGGHPGQRYQQLPPDPFLDLGRGRSSTSRGGNGGFEIATDHTATEAYGFNPPPFFTQNNLSTRDFSPSPSPAGDKENDISGGTLHPNIPHPRRR